MTERNKIKIAVTGGIGSGKTTVSKYISSNFGYYFIDADRVGHELLLKKEIIKELTNLFGEQILTDGVPDRKKIASLVFCEKSNIITFNKIVHPAILTEINKRSEGHLKILVEAALVFEAGWESFFDAVVYIWCGSETKIERIISRDGRTLSEIRCIMQNQIDQTDAFLKTPFIINTEKDIKETYRETDDLIKKIEQSIK